MQGTQTDFKNELLYASFGINYSTLPARVRKVTLSCACMTTSAAQAWLMHILMPALRVYRQDLKCAAAAYHSFLKDRHTLLTGHGLLQGSVVLPTKLTTTVKLLEDGTPVLREVKSPTVSHDDIISNTFWDEHPELLA